VQLLAPEAMLHSQLPALPQLFGACTTVKFDGGPVGLMVSVNVAVPVPPPLVALTVTVDVPAVVGVPEINPLVVFTVKPAGSPVAP